MKEISIIENASMSSRDLAEFISLQRIDGKDINLFEEWFKANNKIAGLHETVVFELGGDGEYIDSDVFISHRAFLAGANSKNDELEFLKKAIEISNNDSNYFREKYAICREHIKTLPEAPKV